MPAPTRVYFDVENTLRVPFISGIQRVVRELSRRLIGKSDLDFEFIPVVYCNYCNGWRKLSVNETEQLQELSFSDAIVNQDIPAYRKIATKLLGKKAKAKVRSLYKRITHPVWHKNLLLPNFEAGSIFLDLDASWHNEVKRSSLLPALKEDGVYVVAFHYDIIPILFPDLMHEKLPPLFIEHLNAQLQECDLFICISRNSEIDLLNYSNNQFPDKKLNTTTIKLGADMFQVSEANVTWPLPEVNLRYILCVGTIEPRKNYNLILDAFDFLSGIYQDLNLVIVGREGWGSAETFSRIKEHKLFGQRLFWLSGVSDDVLSRLYMNAFLTVVPSLYEGFGLPVIEALKWGCVTLSSSRGALTEAGGNFVEYFDPDDQSALVGLLESYLSSNDREINKVFLKKYNVPSWTDTVVELKRILNDSFSFQGSHM